MPLRTAQKHQVATANTAAAIQMSVGAAVEVVLSQLDGIFTLEEQHKNTTEDFGGRGV